MGRPLANRIAAAARAALLAAAALAGASVAAAEGRLVRLDTGAAGRGWEAVGRINLGRAGFCTGALIAPDLVLTAAHCLYDPDSGRPVALGDIEFLAGWRNGRAEAYRKVRRAAQHPRYAYEGRDRLDRVAYDVAVLELEQPIRTTGIRPFATAPRTAAGAEVGVVSYARGRDQAPSLEQVCHVLAREGSVLMLSCAVEFGASGAPVFAFVAGEARIVSVVSAKAEANARPVALGTEVGATLPEVLAALAGQPGPFARSGGAAADAKFLRP
jgi:V8-like Glu-specific endopeptidase